MTKKDAIVHPILEALSKIKLLANSDEVDRAAVANSPSEIISHLTSFSTECKLSLPHRMLAANNGAYEQLISLIESNKNNPELLSSAVFSITALTEGNPDILTPHAASILTELSDKYSTDLNSEVMEALARWCQNSNFKHEANRESLFTAGVAHSLVKSLEGVSAEPHKTRIIATLKALRSFTLDDDIRAEFGKAHENCRNLVEEEGLIQVALGIIKGCLPTASGAVAGEALSIISSICVRAEYCQQACESDALNVINSILEKFPDSAILSKQSITLLSTLAGDDKVKVAVMKTNAPHLIAHALDRHQLQVGVCSAGCSAVSMLALRHPQHSVVLIQCGAAAAVVQAMKQHPKEKQLQKKGCLAIRNLCSRSAESAAHMRELQAEDLVRNAVVIHGDAVKDMAKSALRDLGADVELVERWHGKGHEIQH